MATGLDDVHFKEKTGSKSTDDQNDANDTVDEPADGASSRLNFWPYGNHSVLIGCGLGRAAIAEPPPNRLERLRVRPVSILT
jgi:hypothetical protein